MTNGPESSISDDSSDHDSSGDDDVLDGIMADYLERLELGESPDPSHYLAEYPEHGDELRSFFRNHHWMGETPIPEPTSLCGHQVGPYVIESEIARGGMGVVYKAHQKGLDRPVAIKLIGSGILASDEERKRFRIEAEAAAKLDHPGIISIHEIGSWNGYEYFSMSFVDGPTLQKHVDERSMGDDEVAKLVRDVALAVGYANAAGIVHRDLKPDNILINQDGRPLVADFGLAKLHREGTMLTRTGQVLGTPHYMSPEQASGKTATTAASDIYSLGAILFALITGVPPHQGDHPAEVLRKVLQDEPSPPRSIRPSVPRELENICMKALRFEPENRYRSANALAEDLDRFLCGETTTAASSGLIERVAREIGRDQHQDHFQEWPATLVVLGWIIFIAHVLIFLLLELGLPNEVAYWPPRLTMLLLIVGTIYRARDGSLSPRSIAERPVWSIWLGYLSALAVINCLLYMGRLDHDFGGIYEGIGTITYAALFPLASALSGFAFVAMSGHIWGGSALCGVAFFALAPVTALFPRFAPLMFGSAYLLSVLAISRHYRKIGK